MTYDPVLASRSFPVGHEGSRVPLSFRVEGGLHYIRGNAAPYFSLTYTEHRRGFPNQCYSGGAGHEKILKYFPQFADLAALHLSDIDGTPSSAEANGWYWLAGTMGGAGETYHGGNRETYGRMIHPEAENIADDCLRTFADHCRIPLDEARAIRTKVKLIHDIDGNDWHDWAPSRAAWGELMEEMRPRWKAEAEACIAHHNLKVYGDPWPATEKEVA